MTARDNKGRFCKVKPEDYKNKLTEAIKFLLDCTKEEGIGNFSESKNYYLKMTSNGVSTFPLSPDTYLDLSVLYDILK